MEKVTATRFLVNHVLQALDNIFQGQKMGYSTEAYMTEVCRETLEKWKHPCPYLFTPRAVIEVANVLNFRVVITNGTATLQAQDEPTMALVREVYDTYETFGE